MEERNRCLKSLQRIEKTTNVPEEEEKNNSDNGEDEEDAEIQELTEANAILKKKIEAVQAERDREQKRLEELQAQLKEKEKPCKHDEEKKKNYSVPQQRESIGFSVDTLLALLCKGNIFSAQVTLKQSDVGQLILVYPDQTVEETCLHVERFLRHRIRFSSLQGLKDGVLQYHNELETNKAKILSFLVDESCQLWTNGAPELTLQDIDQFRVLEDVFFGFLGLDENNGRERPISLLKPTSIADIVNACIIGLQHLNKEEKKYETLTDLIVGLQDKHADEIKRQDDALEKTKQPVHLVVDFFNSGVALFNVQVQIDMKALQTIIDAAGGTGSIARRKLERLVIDRKVFSSLEDLSTAISET